MYLRLCIVLLLVSGCGVNVREVTVPIEHQTTLNSLTIEDSADVEIQPVQGLPTAPVAITWGIDGIDAPTYGALHVLDITVSRDTVVIYNSESRLAFLTPVPGETLRIQQGRDSIPQAYLEGEPEIEEITVEIVERESALDKAESFMGRIFGLIFKMLIILGIVVVLGIAGYITYAVIRSREQKKFTRGVADIATDLVSNLTKGKLKKK